MLIFFLLGIRDEEWNTPSQSWKPTVIPEWPTNSQTWPSNQFPEPDWPTPSQEWPNFPYTYPTQNLSPSKLSTETIIIISVVSSVGGIAIIALIVILALKWKKIKCKKSKYEQPNISAQTDTLLQNTDDL